MRNIAIFFDNALEAIPFALISINNNIRIVRDFRSVKFPSDLLTLGYRDALDSFRRLGIDLIRNQIRLEILYSISIEYSKGDQTKKWNYRKPDIIGKYVDSRLLHYLGEYETGKTTWADFSRVLIGAKLELLQAVDRAYDDLKNYYTAQIHTRNEWIQLEYIVDDYFLKNQYVGITVDKEKIKSYLFELNENKYSALLFLEKYFNLDISGIYLSDEKINELTLCDYREDERTEELTELFQVVNISDKRIEAISNVREYRLDYANLIKHYSLNQNQSVYPQYETIGSSSGRIFISSPGTQYLKKTRRNIFSTKEGFRITYFDFRNYEPGIAAGLSNDKAFIEYYNTGDMYSKIANELFRNPLKRKEVKITILSSLYGMSKESLVKYFSKSYDFNPLIVVDLLESFKVFCSWRKDIIDQAINAKVVIDKSYTRRYLPNNDWKIRTSALNHIIQSTGSRILKKCIAEIINISGVRILIPMHDALLCEVADENYVALTKIVIAQMEVIFKEEIVNVSSKVIISDFSQ